MKKIEIISSVQNGNLKRNRNTILDAIRAFEGKEVVITIQRKRKARSNNQNRYYFSVIIILLCDAIKNEWGEVWSKDKAHEFLKSKFLFFERMNEDTGEIIKIPKSTTECSTIEFEDYLMQCREFMIDWFGVNVPLPNEEITLSI